MGIPGQELNILLRLTLAIFVGGLVGWERQLERKPAGLRTHMLVSLGAALFVLTGVQANFSSPDPDSISRIIQGITAGIGFLGAGEIFSRSPENGGKYRIHGLTSAAAIWLSASLGTAAGFGLWFTSLTGSLLTFLILWGVKKLE